MNQFSLKKYKIWVVSTILTTILVAYYFSLPEPLFKNDYATVLNDNNQNLLGASISDDGQWRFPPVDSLPEKYKQALIFFEDQYFYKHPGFNPFSFVRAATQNYKAGDVVSGGSSITMQVIRLSRQGKSRTYLEKIIEIILATRLELRYSKDEILNIYASHAPFGGNIVGINAASWRYFDRNPEELSWGEACLLAVLPNSPALIHPGRNRNQLIAKRNRLIDRMTAKGIINELTSDLAKSEPVPSHPEQLPDIARHLLVKSIKDGYKYEILNSTIDRNIQGRVDQIINRHGQKLKANEIHNAAAIVIEVSTGNTLAYVGNLKNEGEAHSSYVDLIQAKRSTGSILKPFLYAAMLDEGLLLPKTLIPDIPTILDGFAPKNFSETFDGAVPADRALARSLNVPAVYMLKEYSYDKFHKKLLDLGLTSIQKPASHYGLSLILGGAEASLWELTGIYASMARTLTNYFIYPEPLRYNQNDFHPPVYTNNLSGKAKMASHSTIDAGALWLTFNAMLDVNRPDEESSWKLFSSSQKIAWKTGTSFGFRDAWAIGITPEYVVGVWVGNANGEGRPGLTGTDAAAPILFEIFGFLPKRPSWFSTPFSDLKPVRVCGLSGYIASEICTPSDSIWVCKNGSASSVCSYHQLLHMDQTETYRVASDCEPISRMKHVSWFVLPPAMEWYYKNKNSGYRILPPLRADCAGAEAKVSSMQLIYPRNYAKIYVPRELDGTKGKSVFEIAHRSSSAEVYWHLDDHYLGVTKRHHQMGIQPDPGPHLLTWVDDRGESMKIYFEVLGKD